MMGGSATVFALAECEKLHRGFVRAGRRPETRAYGANCLAGSRKYGTPRALPTSSD